MKPNQDPLCPCPDCKAATQVVETRASEHGPRRRRQCVACRKRFTTIEVEIGSLDDLMLFQKKVKALMEELTKVTL